jgi:hypothetical protein
VTSSGYVHQRLGGHADLGHLFDQHFGHLVGRTLVQADADLGVGLSQRGDRPGQHIARLGVGGGDRQCAAVLRRILLADALEVVDLAQDDLDALEHLLTGLGHPLDALAMARKNLDAQLVFQLDDGLGHAGLRGVQRLGGLGQVEVAAHRFLNEPELVQVHGVASSAIRASNAVSRGSSPAAGSCSNCTCGVGGAQRLQQQWQVFSGVFAHAEEQRQHPDLRSARGHQPVGRGGDVGLAEFQVGAGHRRLSDRLAQFVAPPTPPVRARAGRANHGQTRSHRACCHLLSTSHPKAPSETTE